MKNPNSTGNRSLSHVVSVISMTGKGVGYISQDKGDDIEIQPERTRGAMHGDEVRVEIIRDPRARRIQGNVLEITKRAKNRFVGTVVEKDRVLSLKADDRKVTRIITLDESARSAIGFKVLAEISNWSDPLTAKVVQIIGKPGEHNTEITSIVLDKGFDVVFPQGVEEEARLIEQKEKPIPQNEIATRRDMRSTYTFTIDPKDAKDFDDAISYKAIADNVHEIGIHIADVSHYVRPGSALDEEALKRSLSVYLVDRTIPMLPEVLSNDICSLNPHEDKLTFSAIFTIDDKARIKERWFGKTIIRSSKRYTYEDAEAEMQTLDQSSREPLSILRNVARILRKQKFDAGAIDFDTAEIKCELDARGRPVKFYRKQRLEAHMLVEDYMLLANREVAEFIHKSLENTKSATSAVLYRVHDTPDPERLQDISAFLRVLGHDLEAHDGAVTSSAIRKILASVEGIPQEDMIKTAILRSMAKATYSTYNIGHFGLAFKFYAHFTSPIRRYADLLIHRVLFSILTNAHKTHGLRNVTKIGPETTRKEILAAEAERASLKRKQVEYMSERIGQTFEGVISGISEWGIYIADKETGSEGMVRLSDIGGDYFEYHEKNFTVRGKQTKKSFSVGDRVRFKVKGANVEDRQLDYVLV